MKPAIDQYLHGIRNGLSHLEAQAEVIEKVATAAYESIQSGGVLHVFGSGHSHMIAEELFHRAGGLVPVNGMLEEYLMPHMGATRVGPLERMSGLAEMILKVYDLRPKEVLLVASNSGINAVSVEVAQKAKESGVITVAITSLNHSRSVPARAGKKLYEVCDFIIDTGTPVGDACVELRNSKLKVAALSGALSLVAGQMIIARVAERFADSGHVPPIYQSANTPGGDEHNKKLESVYRSRLKRL